VWDRRDPVEWSRAVVIVPAVSATSMGVPVVDVTAVVRLRW
jgi:hypothetical protein